MLFNENVGNNYKYTNPIILSLIIIDGMHIAEGRDPFIMILVIIINIVIINNNNNKNSKIIIILYYLIYKVVFYY